MCLRPATIVLLYSAMLLPKMKILSAEFCWWFEAQRQCNRASRPTFIIKESCVDKKVSNFDDLFRDKYNSYRHVWYTGETSLKRTFWRRIAEVCVNCLYSTIYVTSELFHQNYIISLAKTIQATSTSIYKANFESSRSSSTSISQCNLRILLINQSTNSSNHSIYEFF